MDETSARIMMNDLGASNEPFLFICDFELNRCQVYPREEVPETVQFVTPLAERTERHAPPARQPGFFTSDAVSFREYEEAFTRVLRELQFGNTFLLNLTFPTRIHTDYTLSDIFSASTSPYRLLVEDEFVVFSPECFVRICDGHISTCPMKGTIRKATPNAESLLLSNLKETAEHDTTVDLLRNDLSIHASQVHVSRYRYLETVHTNRGDLLQMSSEISGILPEGYSSMLGDIIFDMLPAGSVSGAPKQETLKIIQAAEKKPRGYYTGVFGWYENGCLDSGVMIRFIEKQGKELYFKSGCGITAMSRVEEEYQELLDKVYLPF
jgi:para-aminobenzoate synthetase component I